MSSFDDSTHRLAGSSGNETGGLFVKKKLKSEGGGAGEEFKAPRGSLLGLDVLAKRKREEREEEGGGRRAEGRKRERWDQRGREDRDGGRDGGFDSDVRISFGRSDRTKVSMVVITADKQTSYFRCLLVCVSIMKVACAILSRVSTHGYLEFIGGVLTWRSQLNIRVQREPTKS